jgi:hypothetical protein
MKQKRPTDNIAQSEEELLKRLYLTLISIVGIMVFVIVSFLFFGPTIGSFFGLLSSHRNDKPNIPTAKPVPPLFSNLPSATNQENFTVSGTAQAGYTVKLFVNGPEKASAITGADGVFNFGDIRLNTGRNSITAKAIDQEGVESDSTLTYIVVLDTQAPKLEIESPKDGDTVRNLDKRVLVKGKLDEKAEVKIGSSLVIMNEDNTFEYLMGLNEGSNKIKVEAKDAAGNTTTKEITVRYEKRGV